MIRIVKPFFIPFYQSPELELYQNPRLEKLPDSIGSLKSLHSLLLKGANVRQFPPSFGRLEKLKILDLSGMKLKALPNLCRCSSVIDRSEYHLEANIF